MKFQKPILSLAAISCLAWSAPSLACSNEDYISSVCAMAAVTLRDFGGGQFFWADGRVLQVSQYAALYSLIGTTYGYINQSTFKIPDMRGRTVIGAGQGGGLPNYAIGESGGNVSFTLTAAQLPAHSHPVSLPVDISKMTATTSLSGLSASITGSLTLKGSTGGTLSHDPTGNSLATTSGPVSIYSNAAPAINMNASSIDSSGLSVGNVTGNASTVLGGTATVTGATGLAGQGQAVIFRSPYIAMKYYIAVTGMYPPND